MKLNHQLFLLLSIIILVPVASTLAQDNELLEIDPSLRGVWRLWATSNDKGKTLEKHDGSTIARVSRSEVKIVGKETLEVEKIIITKTADADKRTAHLVRFTTGLIWGVSKDAENKYVLVQVMDPNTGEENFRLVITVEK